MSEYIFGTTCKRHTKRNAKLLDRICKQEGGHGFVGPVNIPGNNTHGWFTGPNLGSPFDSDLASRVQKAAELMGIEI
jgi:hypothetical protein